MPGIKSSARIRMILGRHVPQAKRDEYLMTPARNVNPASGLNSKLIEKILAAVHEEEIIAMACDVINIPSPTGEELQMAEYMRGALGQLGLNVTWQEVEEGRADRKSTRLNSSHGYISYAVFCLKKKKKNTTTLSTNKSTHRTTTTDSCG